MGFFGFLKRLFFKKKIPELPSEFKEPEKPAFSEQPLSLGTREESSDKLELIKTKLDLLNAKLDGIDRRLQDLERIAEER